MNYFPANLPPLADSAPYIVIGSGIAGLYSALELSKTGQVILITKSAITESNTYYAQGGIAAAIGLNDSPELHYQDTIMAGAGLCNSEAVLTLVYEGLKLVHSLIDLQVPFDKDQGELSLTREAAHSRRRILHADGDATGREISRTLIGHVRKAGVRIYQEHFALALVTQGGRCCGVVTINGRQLNLFLSSAVLLCSGGSGQIYGKTTNPPIATGDGMMLAYNAGAVLRDLEFVQFHPTALDLPSAPAFLISESVRGEGALLLNQAGERFMPKYHSMAELAPRDVVARAIFNETRSADKSQVFLDLTRIAPETVKTRFPNIYATCLQYGLDIAAEPIPVAPAAHYMMGGVHTDLLGRTAVPGLYAAGETASTGVHGANRLASNSLLEGLVFASRIAGYLREQPVQIPKTTADLNICYPRNIRNLNNPGSDRRLLHQIADNCLGIVREKDGLEQAAAFFSPKPEPKTPFQLEPGFFELQNMYALAGMIAQAALRRTESRGGHFRSDYPVPDPNWRCHIGFQNGKIEVAAE